MPSDCSDKYRMSTLISLDEVTFFNWLMMQEGHTSRNIMNCPRELIENIIRRPHVLCCFFVSSRWMSNSLSLPGPIFHLHLYFSLFFSSFSIRLLMPRKQSILPQKCPPNCALPPTLLCRTALPLWFSELNGTYFTGSSYSHEKRGWEYLTLVVIKANNFPRSVQDLIFKKVKLWDLFFSATEKKKRKGKDKLLSLTQWCLLNLNDFTTWSYFSCVLWKAPR